eukprot:s1209_g4.t1
MSEATKKTGRFVAVVEDAVSTQLLAVHQHPKCSFGTSWKAFNQQRQGRSHRALAWCRFLLGLFLLVGAASVYAVYQMLESRNVNVRRFHLVVIIKFFLQDGTVQFGAAPESRERRQDAPQQTCFVLYLFGWYEASGLRCQLCLFDSAHCSDEDGKYTEDDICMQLWIRIGGTCVAALPFTTGLCLASRSLLSSPTLVHLLFAVPCVLGWMSISGHSG